MKIVKTGTPTEKPSVVMVVYGEGGVGKTTFGSTAPKPLLLDFEHGSKYFGLRGIDVDVVQITDWQHWGTAKNPKPDQEGTMRDADLIKTIRGDEYNTIIIDPIGEAMEKLISSVAGHPDTKMRQKDGSPTMAGWGYVKKTFRDFIKFLRDSGKHVILVAHIEEKGDEDRIVKRPLIATKISQEIVNMVDIVGYMTTRQNEDGVDERVILVDPTNDKYTAKDRTGQLDTEIEPNFNAIVEALAGTKDYDWCKAPKNQKLPEDPAEEAVEKEGKKVSEKIDEEAKEEEEVADIESPYDTDDDQKKGTEDIDAQLKKANKKTNGTSKKGK